MSARCTPDHPPYAWMIGAAIRSLAEEGGSTEAAISAYIRANYDDLPWGHDRLLPYYLDKLTKIGEFALASPGRYLIADDDGQRFTYPRTSKSRSSLAVGNDETPQLLLPSASPPSHGKRRRGERGSKLRHSEPVNGHPGDLSKKPGSKTGAGRDCSWSASKRRRGRTPRRKESPAMKETSAAGYGDSQGTLPATAENDSPLRLNPSPPFPEPTEAPPSTQPKSNEHDLGAFHGLLTAPLINSACKKGDRQDGKDPATTSAAGSTGLSVPPPLPEPVETPSSRLTPTMAKRMPSEEYIARRMEFVLALAVPEKSASDGDEFWHEPKPKPQGGDSDRSRNPGSVAGSSNERDLAEAIGDRGSITRTSSRGRPLKSKSN